MIKDKTASKKSAGRIEINTMPKKPFYTNLFIFSLAIVIVLVIQTRGTPKLIYNPLKELPLDIADFYGVDDKYPESVYSALNADTHIYRHYQKRNGTQADLYIGYYSTEKGGRTPHTPYGCLPGSGWGILKSKKEKLHPAGYPKPVKVNAILASRDNKYLILFHWYQVEGSKVLNNGIQHNLQRFMNRLINNRSDGAFVQVSAIMEENNIEEINDSVRNLTKSLLQLMPEYWPVESG